MDDIKLILKSLLTQEELAELQFVEKKPVGAPPDFIGIIKMKNPAPRRNMYLHLYQNDAYYTAQMFNLNIETGEKEPLSSKVMASGALEIMKKVTPTIKSLASSED